MKNKSINYVPPGGPEFKQEKLNPFQKNLLVRWINTLDVWEQYLSSDNIIEELKTGILICNILKFHQPNLDFTGVNSKARARKQCLNNIERALSILFQKGAAPRNMPIADEIFEGEKFQDKVWLLLKTIFDVFAMHDVSVLMPKIIKWINISLSYFPGRELMSHKAEQIYHEFKSGVNLACILALYVEDEALQPDFRMIFEHPQNRQELLSNLSYVFALAIKNNVPIYLKPQEYLDYEQHNFLLLQLYYLYCKFKSLQPLFSREEPLPHFIFKDEGRILEDNSQTSQSNATPQRSHRGENDSSDVKTNSMGVIDEVDSNDFSSTMKSQSKSTEGRGRINHQKVQSYLSSTSPQQFNQTSYIQSYTPHNHNNEEDGNVMDEEDDVSHGGSLSNRQHDFHMMKSNIKQASDNLLSSRSQRSQIQSSSSKPYYQVDENIGIFSDPYHKPQQKVEPYIMERRGFFMEDLRSQLGKVQQKVEVNEDQLTQMYYSSAGGNQTAQFNNNFTTFDGAQSQHVKQESAMGGGQQMMSQFEIKEPKFLVQDYQQEKLKIMDENGDLDEYKCLQLLFTPQLCSMELNGQSFSKAFIVIKAAECFYSELTEGYSIKAFEYPTRKPIIDIKMNTIETIIMKNIIQRQFLIRADGGKTKLLVEISDKSDSFFQALSYIFQKTSIKRF